MPIHDWTRVFAGMFHDFHHEWISAIRRALNHGVLPAGYYAAAEQVARPALADALTLQDSSAPGFGTAAGEPDPAEPGGVAVAVRPPKLAVVDAADDAAIYATRADRVAIRHVSGDRVVAVVELVSPGNKQKRAAAEDFVGKAVGLLAGGVHLQVIDLFPPRRFDPDGMHGAIWEQVGRPYAPPPGKPLAAAAYAAGRPLTCYVEPLAVGDRLPDLPLFLTPERYVNVPLEATYAAAYDEVPEPWKRLVEGNGD